MSKGKIMQCAFREVIVASGKNYAISTAVSCQCYTALLKWAASPKTSSAH